MNGQRPAVAPGASGFPSQCAAVEVRLGVPTPMGKRLFHNCCAAADAPYARGSRCRAVGEDEEEEVLESVLLLG